MNERDDNDDSFDLSAFWGDLQDLEDGTLAPERREAITALLNRSPAARRAYFDYFHQAAVIGMEAAKILEGGKMASVIPLSRKRPWKSHLAIAAALAVLAALIGTVLIGNKRRNGEMRAVAVEGTVWELNGVSRSAAEMETTVKPGDALRVLSGMVKFELASGSVLVLQGPARVSFPGTRHPVLEEGWLWIDTNGSTDAFEVSTPSFKVRDIGTRFGVRVGNDGGSEIHLLEGGVEVAAKNGGGEPVRLSPDGKGVAVGSDGARRAVPLANDPFHMLQRIMSGQGTYRTAILSQNPSGYWKFDEEEALWSENEVHEQRRARCGPQVRAIQPGTDGVEPIPGFGAANRAVYLPGDENMRPGQSVVALLDGGEGVGRAQGAVTFWIRSSGTRTEPVTLWIAGAINPYDRAPGHSLAHAYLDASGRLSFVMANGPEEAVVISERKIADELWHHIGVSWTASAIELYVDGEQVARREGIPLLDQWFSYGNFLRFGKASDNDVKKGFRGFQGWFDEFAIWGRPLTPDEVRQQYRSAHVQD